MRTRLAGVVASVRERVRRCVRILGCAAQAGPWSLGLALVFLTLTSVVPVFQKIVTGAVVRAVGSVIGRGASASAATPSLIVLAALLAVGQVAILGNVVILGRVTRQTDRLLQLRVLRAVNRPVGIGHLEDPAVRDQIELARSAVLGHGTPGAAVTGYLGYAGMRLGGLGSGLLVARYRWWLALLLIAASPCIGHFARAEHERLWGGRIAELRPLRRATYFRDLALSPTGAKEVRLFGLAPWLRERFSEDWRAAITRVWSVRSAGAAGRLAYVAVTAVAFGPAFLLVIHDGVTGVISAAQMTVVLQGVAGMMTLGMIHPFFGSAIEAGAAALPALDALEVLDDERPGGAEAHGLPARFIAFENVTFCYPGTDRPVLDGLDLHITAGTSVAIVGVNGAGKTTLVKLLARLYEPSRGRIAIDGLDLSEIEPQSWRRRLGAVFQDFVHFQLSARENVTLGAPHIEDDTRALERAASRAGLAPLVHALPRGWDTPLARQYDDGTELSGGEWQRVALARALFAVEGGASVLVLDEPTANLDVRAEAEIYERFLELTRGLTSIVISHRFSTVRRADLIYVVDGGRVTEHGTHDELIALDGTYALMFRLQAARFTSDEEEPADA
jgi:ATP-binding cassette subfamily B protein